ncbi:hypothetical protein LXA43DRAFT_977864 [Ganoderma leucocontextum]|nr:hypothetical protein LXA43DRAFT_977864 [Ganoderma leucocontextum]
MPPIPPRTRKGTKRFTGLAVASASRGGAKVRGGSAARAPDHSQNEQLQAKIKKLERENAKLRKHTSGKATSAKRRPESGDEDDDDDRLSVESEEESDTLVESRSMKSKFESRGIYTTEAPQAKKLRRLDDPAARKSPLAGASSADKDLESRQSTSSASHQSTGGRSSRKSTGSSSQPRAPQADLQSPVTTEELPFRGRIQPGASDAKASDYEPHATRLILAACRHFEVLVLTNDPFPDESKQELWVKDAWACTSDAVKRYYRLPDRVKKLIMSRTSHARGALKDCIRPLVTPKYGFSSSMDEATKITNRTLYERLLDLNNPEGPEPIFHYQNVDAVTGFARNEIVSHAIREQWFRNSDGIGLRLPTQFSPIREETLGIIFTAIEFCLDQWADGTLSEGARFTEKVYKPKYENHLRLIKEWTKIDPTVTEKIRKQMYDEARYVSCRSTIPCIAELDELARTLG